MRVKQRMLFVLKIIIILCIFILVVKLAYLIYTTYFQEHKKTYFDKVTAIVPGKSMFISAGSNNDNDYQYEKAKITKYNSKKEKDWERIFNKGYNSSFFNVVIDEDAVVAVGSYEASEAEQEEQVRTALLVKYDTEGNFLFEKEFQDLGNSKFVDVSVVDDGYLVVGQSITRKNSPDLSEQGGAILVKYSKDGKLMWKCDYGDSKTGAYQGLVVLDNYIYVVGKNLDDVGILSKYSMDGQLVRVVAYPATDEVGFSSIIGIDTKLVVTSAKKQDNNQYDALLVQYDLDLEYVVETTYSSGDRASFNKLVVDENQDLVVIGLVATKRKKSYTYNALIGKYRLNLEKADVLVYGNEEDDYFTDIALDGKNYLIAGYSYYQNDGYLSKLFTYSDALKSLEVK